MDNEADSTKDIAGTLSAHVTAAVQSILSGDSVSTEEDFKRLLARIRKLVESKIKHEATRGETRDVVAEVLYSRLAHGFGELAERGGDLTAEPRRVAEMVMGGIVTASALAEFASVLDQVMEEMVKPHDYHMAGRADFISINELFQLLNAGKHTGRLVFERGDEQTDVYLLNGSIAFVDPDRMTQRLIRGQGMTKWREVPAALHTEANQVRSTEGTPILLSLLEKGFFRQNEIRDQLRTHGAEKIYSLLSDESNCSFSYKAMPPPDFVTQYNIGLPVMPLLLEGVKRVDDWRRIQRVFPDLDEPIRPAPDLFARIAEMSLDVVEIKILTLVNGENSFAMIREITGMDNFDLGMLLVGFGRDGILEPPGGQHTLFDDNMDSMESMEAAVEALDANAALEGIPDTLDAVFGGDEDEFGLGFLRAARDGEE